jgi:hypothetical protein
MNSNAREFEKLVKPDRYQVFLFTCPATMPFAFATHPWFVVNRKGTISRWEIFWRPQDWIFRWGHLHKDFYSPTQGIEMFFFSDKHFWKRSEIVGAIEGTEGSLAQKMADRIEASPDAYPFCNRYAISGPNSNTYIQWALNQFPESGMCLPWNAIGKNFGK